MFLRANIFCIEIIHSPVEKLAPNFNRQFPIICFKFMTRYKREPVFKKFLVYSLPVSISFLKFVCESQYEYLE